MRIGLISDIHAGYYRGTRTNDKGVNQREADIYTAARRGVENLMEARVDVIVDLGDMAHTPSPRKRAVKFLIELVKYAKVPFYSANGNHTLQRTASDLHLYDLISEYAPNFRGYTTSTFNKDLRGLFIPYGTSDEIREALSLLPEGALFIAGHWAADDVPFPGDHVRVDELPRGIPTFLGHYHTRRYNVDYSWYVPPTMFGSEYKEFIRLSPDMECQGPIYIGSTERLAWGEAKNPTGVAIWDTETKALEFVDHETRRWVDIVVNPDNYLEDAHYEHIEDSISRVTVEATAEEYAAMDLVAIRKKVASSLEHQIRRRSEDTTVEPVSAGSLSLSAGWSNHIKTAKIPKGVTRKEVERVGLNAIGSGVGG